MNNGICSKADVGDTKQLIDKRDQKKYWIAKLADSSCWMVQNLALDLYDSKTNKAVVLTSELSDADWTSTTGASALWNDTSYTTAHYYNPGLQLCNGSSCSEATGDYDEHYLTGNYYNWYAATASTGNGMSSGSASGSICPKGWKLPVDGAYSSLFTAYGTYQDKTNIYGAQDIKQPPLYFVYGGYVDNSTLNGVSSSGYYWSATASSASNAYNLYFRSSSVSPSSSSNRYSGLSVRCVAR